MCHGGGYGTVQTAVRANFFALVWLPCPIAFSGSETRLMEIGATSECRVSTAINSADTTFVACMEEENLALDL